MGVSIRQQKRDGEWYVHIRHGGQRYAQKCLNEDHAKDAQKAILIAMASGQFKLADMKAQREGARTERPQAATLKEFFEQTMSPMWKGSLSPKTYDRYETSFRIHILPAIGDVPVVDISRDRLKSFAASLTTVTAIKRAKTEESLKAEKDRRLSKDSIRNIVAALRGALTEAVERGHLPANPASKLGKFYSEAGQVREEVDPFTIEEIPLLLNSTSQHFGFENYVLTLCALHTGLRAGEIAGLQWSDVDFANRFLIVRRQYRDGAQKRTKTKKLRKVDISDALLQELQALRKLRREKALAAGQNEIPEWVFLSPGKKLKDDKRELGQPVDMDNFRNRVFWIACDKAKIRRRRFHDTRHSFASILLMNGESPAYVKEQLGHSSIKITVDVYGHFIPGANRQAVNRLPSITSARIASKTAGD
jgi:integrase